jgi:hypothetical protein
MPPNLHDHELAQPPKDALAADARLLGLGRRQSNEGPKGPTRTVADTETRGSAASNGLNGRASQARNPQTKRAESTLVPPTEMENGGVFHSTVLMFTYQLGTWSGCTA